MAIRFAVILAAGLAITPHAGAQQAIAGRVSAEGSGLPLSGVSLTLDGEQVASTTNANGTFTIPSVAAGDHTLTVSLIGYETAERMVTAAVGESVEVLVSLVEAPIALAPVQVYGERVGRGLDATVGSVAALDGAAIRGAGLNTLRDALRFIPNARDADWVDAGILIRGINSEGVAGPTENPLATFYVDGVAQTLASGRRGPTGGWDIQQMEVWRGPQSTLSGRNALAGKVEIRTNDPTMDWEMAAQTELGNRSHNQQAVAVSGPLVEDRFAFRIAAERRHANGQIRYPLYDGMPRLDERSNDDYAHARAKLLFLPSGGPDGFRAQLHVSSTYNSPSYDDVDGPSADGSSAGISGPIAFEDRYWGFQSTPVFVEARSGRANQAALELTLPTNSGWTLYSTSTWLDATTKRPSVDQSSVGDIGDTELSQEVRGVFGGVSLEGVVGAYLLSGDGETSRRQQRPWESFVRNDTGEDSFTNTALFGEVRWSVLSNLTLIAGGRYDREEREFSSLSRRVEGGSVISESSNATDAAFAAFLPKFGASVDLSGRSTFGVTVQKAYRAGGAAVDFVAGGSYEYDPEYAWNYEVAWRGRSADNRLRYALNLFYLDWRDQQINVPQIPGDFTSDIILNAGESTVMGAEVELAGQLTESLQAFGSLGYARTEFEDFSFLQFGNLLDLAGESFPQSPALSTVAGLEYRAPSGWFVGADANHTSEATSRSVLEGRPVDKLPSYTLLNVRVGAEYGAFTVTGYVENLTDEDYFLYRYDQSDFQLATLGASRAVGVIVNARVGGF